MEYLNDTSQICLTLKITLMRLSILNLSCLILELSALDRFGGKCFLPLVPLLYGISDEIYRYVQQQRLHIVT